jgi:hypothetical protein
MRKYEEYLREFLKQLSRITHSIAFHESVEAFYSSHNEKIRRIIGEIMEKDIDTQDLARTHLSNYVRHLRSYCELLAPLKRQNIQNI